MNECCVDRLIHVIRNCALAIAKYEFELELMMILIRFCLFFFQLRKNSTATIISMENFALHWIWKVALIVSMVAIIQVKKNPFNTIECMVSWVAKPNRQQWIFIILFCILDWACGGQWNRAYQFVQLLVNAFTAAHIDIIVFFDGTLKENKKNARERNELRQKTTSVLKHIRMIGTPPPKIWWMPPSGLRTCLRNALRSLNVVVVWMHHFVRIFV